MNVSLYQAAAALDGNVRWQQMIAENIAAGSSPAFKKQDISFASLQAGILGGSSEALFAQRNPSILPRPIVGTNFAQGQLRRTGDKRDIALEDDGSTSRIGFLTVQKPNGDILYSRDGRFSVDPVSGTMVNKDKFPLLGEGGPIQVDLRNWSDTIEISATGEISQGGITRGRLNVVEFDHPSQLDRIGAGYFVAKPGIQPSPLETTKIAQGFTEEANTVATVEMSTLLQALRHFEANQRVIQLQDERMGRAIQELSATS